MPVLKILFPTVARQVKGAREYRVKVPTDLDLEFAVSRKKGSLKFKTRAMDISMSGMSLYDPNGRHSTLKTDDKVRFQIIEGEMLLMTLDAVVRHVTRLRDSKGLQYIFGVQFDLASRSLASDVEQLVATIQRARLRKLSEIEGEYGVNLSNW
jgi:c-di-GMP-binding flagellar brake protein YcgR